MSEIYNEAYYHSGCGPVPYEEPEHWVKFLAGLRTESYLIYIRKQYWMPGVQWGTWLQPCGTAV